MSTIVLTAETESLPLGNLLQQMESGGVEVRDEQGNVVAFVLSPADHQAWLYAEAHRDLDEHQEEVRAALGRRGGVTTVELLKNAATAAQQVSQQ